MNSVASFMFHQDPISGVISATPTPGCKSIGVSATTRKDAEAEALAVFAREDAEEARTALQRVEHAMGFC